MHRQALSRRTAQQTPHEMRVLSLCRIQMGARRPHLPELQWFRRGNNAALPSSAQPETPVEAELQSSPVQKVGVRILNARLKLTTHKLLL